MQESQWVKFYVDIEHTEYLQKPTNEEKREIVFKISNCLSKIIGVQVDGLTWDGSRENKRKFDKEKRWKLSLHMICTNIEVKLAQAEHIYNELDAMLKRDPVWSQKAFYQTVDCNGVSMTNSIVDPSVYKPNQLMRLPMSWKFMIDSKTKQQIVLVIHLSPSLILKEIILYSIAILGFLFNSH